MFLPRILCLGAFLLTTSLAAAELRDGLLFYAGFETSADADVAQGAKRPAAALEAAPGKSGRGLKISQDKSLNYNNLSNLELAAGTVAFWVNPGWDDAANPKENRTLFRAVHLSANWTKASKRLFFMTGSTHPEKGFGWDYSLSSAAINAWKPGEFHHVALTWNRGTGEKSLYLDGVLQGTKTTTRFPDSLPSSAPLEFGVHAPGVYDEIAIWNRPLDARDISFLAERPDDAARQLLAEKAEEKALPPPEAAAYREKLAFYVSFETGTVPDVSSGTYRNQPEASPIAAPGIAGKGMRLNRLDFDSTGVVTPAAGTVSFWIAPGPGFLPAANDSRALCRTGHLALTLFPKGIQFMTGRTENGKFRWNYSCGNDRPARWKENSWHHVAVTWDRAAGQKTIWLDGEAVSTAETDVFPEAIHPAGEFIFAAAPGVYDELAVWNRVLSPAEILRPTVSPARAARAAGVKTGSAETTLDFQQRGREKLTHSANPLASLRFPLPKPDPEASIVEPGQPFQAEIRVENPAIAPVESTLRLTLRDFHLNPVVEEEVALRVPAGGSTVIRREYRAEKRGIYKVEAVLPDGSLRDVASFGCWKITQKPDPDSFFGSHVNSWAGGKYLRQAAKLGQNWMRNHNMLQSLWWEKVQPESGAFTWTEDAILAQLKAMEMPILGQLFTTPNWAAAGGPRPPSKGYNQCLKPDPAAFEEYVYKTVSRYKDQVRCWEIWNEPDVSMFWKASPEEFAELVQVAVRAVRRADPTALVMAGGYTSPARAWHRRAAKAGAFKNLDAVSFHAYLSGKLQTEERLERLQNVMAHFRELTVKYGDGRELPLWDSEGGAGSTTFLRGLEFPQLPPPEKRPPLNWRETAIGMVQFEALLQSEGIVKNFLYFQNPINPNSMEAFENLSALDVNQAPKPYLMARAAMQEQLDYTRFFARLRREELRYFAILFQHKTDPASSRALLWCGPGGRLELKLALPGKTEAVDLMGNRVELPAPVVVTEEPLYLRAAAPAAALKKALESAAIRVVTPPLLLEKREEETGHGLPHLPDFAAPAEAPAKVFTIDLRPFCTMGLADQTAGDGKGGWADEGNLNDMRDLKTGKRTLLGVPFDLIVPAENGGKAVITLRSRNLTPTLPESSGPIPVNRKVRNLYFLHAAAWGTPGVIGDYFIGYADGTKETIEVDIPRNCNNWWNGYAENEESRPVPVRVTNTLNELPAWRYLRVLEYQNPKMEVPIRSIEFRSRNGSQTPILLAVSGVEL